MHYWSKMQKKVKFNHKIGVFSLIEKNIVGLFHQWLRIVCLWSNLKDVLMVRYLLETFYFVVLFKKRYILSISFQYFGSGFFNFL